MAEKLRNRFSEQLTISAAEFTEARAKMLAAQDPQSIMREFINDLLFGQESQFLDDVGDILVDAFTEMGTGFGSY